MQTIPLGLTLPPGQLISKQERTSCPDLRWPELCQSAAASFTYVITPKHDTCVALRHRKVYTQLQHSGKQRVTDSLPTVWPLSHLVHRKLLLLLWNDLREERLQYISRRSCPCCVSVHVIVREPVTTGLTEFPVKLQNCYVDRRTSPDSPFT